MRSVATIDFHAYVYPAILAEHSTMRTNIKESPGQKGLDNMEEIVMIMNFLCKNNNFFPICYTIGQN